MQTKCSEVFSKYSLIWCESPRYAHTISFESELLTIRREKIKKNDTAHRSGIFGLNFSASRYSRTVTKQRSMNPLREKQFHFSKMTEQTYTKVFEQCKIIVQESLIPKIQLEEALNKIKHLESTLEKATTEEGFQIDLFQMALLANQIEAQQVLAANTIGQSDRNLIGSIRKLI